MTRLPGYLARFSRTELSGRKGRERCREDAKRRVHCIGFCDRVWVDLQREDFVCWKERRLSSYSVCMSSCLLG